jgi:hypothetical protein
MPMVIDFTEILKEVKYIQMEYINSKGSKAAYLIDITVNPFECIGTDKETLSTLSFDDPLYEQARHELLMTLNYPQRTERVSSEPYNGSFENVAKGLKVKNGKLYLYGYLESKEIIEEVSKEDTRRPLTKAKDFIRETYMHSTRFRNFIISEERLISGTKVGNILFL